VPLFIGASLSDRHGADYGHSPSVVQGLCALSYLGVDS
jgi:hypothetical protein